MSTGALHEEEGLQRDLPNTCNDGVTASWVPKFCYLPSVAPLNEFTSNS